MKNELFEVEFEETEKFNNGVEDGTRRDLDIMPCDHGFYTDENNNELCHATGMEVSFDGQWWNEYIDFTGCYHYGR